MVLVLSAALGSLAGAAGKRILKGRAAPAPSRRASGPRCLQRPSFHREWLSQSGSSPFPAFAATAAQPLPGVSFLQEPLTVPGSWPGEAFNPSWDGVGFWAYQIASAIPASLDLYRGGAGTLAAGALRGGRALGQFSLSRCYLAHTLLFPPLALPALALHLVLIRKVGISGPVLFLPTPAL